MTEKQVKEIVKMTIDELTRRNVIDVNQYSLIAHSVESRLNSFFAGSSDTQLANVLRELTDDLYLDIIFYHYRDLVTLERIAEIFDKDVSTIKRNKKRLIIKIYKLLEES